MADIDRPTVKEAEMFDAMLVPPPIGMRVWALNEGGCVVPTIVDSNFYNQFDAWYHYIKVPESVKQRQMERNGTYTEYPFGSHQPQL